MKLKKLVITGIGILACIGFTNVATAQEKTDKNASSTSTTKTTTETDNGTTTKTKTKTVK